jgi:hypothetical protein
MPILSAWPSYASCVSGGSQHTLVSTMRLPRMYDLAPMYAARMTYRRPAPNIVHFWSVWVHLRIALQVAMGNLSKPMRCQLYEV